MRRVVVLLGVPVLAFGAMVMVWLGSRDPAFYGEPLRTPIAATDFTLTDQRGQPFTMSDASGKVVVVTFLYTSCVDVCPGIALKLKVTGQRLKEGTEQVKWVAVSTDPQRDTVGRIAEYSEALGMGDSWHYLTGPEETLRPVWQAYLVGESVVDQGHPYLTEEALTLTGIYHGLVEEQVQLAEHVRERFGRDYHVSHGTPVLIVDRQQRIRVLYGADFDPDQLADDIEILLDQKK